MKFIVHGCENWPNSFSAFQQKYLTEMFKHQGSKGTLQEKHLKNKTKLASQLYQHRIRKIEWTRIETIDNLFRWWCLLFCRPNASYLIYHIKSFSKKQNLPYTMK